MFSQSLLTLEFDRVIALIALETKSTPGREALARRRPYHSVEACERAQGELAEMVRFFLQEGQLPLAGLTDVASLLQKELLEFFESWQVLRAVRATQSLRETFLRSDNPYPYLTEIAKGIDDLSPLISSISRYFGKDGKLREEASAGLRSLRTRIQTARSAIQKTLHDLMNRHADAVQESIITLRGDRYCIPVRADHRNAVTGILHERSGSGASFFIEPMQVVEMNNDLADLLMQEREEIARITRFVSQQLLAARDAILAAIEIAGELDARQACAILEQEIGGTRPTFTTRRELRLLDARHPLLDQRLTAMRREAFGESSAPAERIVPTTLVLSEGDPALVISGPNAGGKTVALKTAGLLVAMATSGLPFPAAEGSVVPVVDDLHVLIGDDQSLLEHLSTFSAYLVRLKRVLTSVTNNSLVLLDELGSGTDPEEGSALAASTIEYLVDRGALLIVTTHLSSLKSFAIRDARVANASMEFDAVSGRPTFRLIPGIPGRSRAIDVAQMIGLPDAIIASARAKLGSEQQEIDQLVSQLQKTMTEVIAERQAIETLRSDLARKQESVEQRDAELKSDKQKLAARYRDEIDRMKDDVQRALQLELRRLREADRLEREKAKPEAITEAIVRPLDRDDSIEDERRPIAVGDRAEHRRFRVVGEVESIDGKRVVL
ncbi:MAG TPA: hypothetical protein VIL97_10040, partial [Thermoanaerobaculia bacterium]